MASAMIELQGVEISFDSETILADVNLSIQTGENFVFVGPSGTGKTVLLKIMGGILPPTKGRVLVEGQDLYSLSELQRANVMRRMGMLFQKNALFDSLTCGENIAFPLRETTQLSESAIQEKVKFFLEAVGLSHALGLYPDEISGGMQKRLGIARALALDPEIIFYDDPTAGLDPITSRKIIDLICELQKKKSATTVSITNEMNRAYQMADRIALVTGRGVLVTGSTIETKAHKDPRVRQFINGVLDGPLTKDAES